MPVPVSSCCSSLSPRRTPQSFASRPSSAGVRTIGERTAPISYQWPPTRPPSAPPPSSAPLQTAAQVLQPPPSAVDRRRPLAARVPPSRADFAGLPTAELPIRAGSPPAIIMAHSEKERAQPAPRTLVSDFHDRFWMARDAQGDAAASAAASLAALSEQASRRSAAAHLYSVRATHRVAAQVFAVVRHRFLNDFGEEPLMSELKAEVEQAVGSAIHSELCHVFDEVSGTHHLVCAQGAVAPPEAPGMAPGPLDRGTTIKPGWKDLVDGPAAMLRQKLALAEQRHRTERTKLEEKISELQHQIRVLERTIHQTLRDKAAAERAAPRHI